MRENDSRAVATGGERMLGHYEPDPLDPLATVGDDELEIPVMKLVQVVSRDVDTQMAGQFYDPLSGEYRPMLNVAVIKLSRSRSLFGDKLGEPPLCSSDDAKTPRERVQVGDEITGPTCEQCHFSQWGSADRGRGQACRFSYNLLCFDLDIYQPYILRVSGTSLLPFRRYISGLKRAQTPFYAVETHITSRAQEFEMGKAFVLRFETDTVLEGEERERMRGYAAHYQQLEIAPDEGEMGFADEPEDVPF